MILNWNGPRVMGVLAMTRAIGDRALRPFVIPDPEVRGTGGVWGSGIRFSPLKGRRMSPCLVV